MQPIYRVQSVNLCTHNSVKQGEDMLLHVRKCQPRSSWYQFRSAASAQGWALCGSGLQVKAMNPSSECSCSPVLAKLYIMTSFVSANSHCTANTTIQMSLTILFYFIMWEEWMADCSWDTTRKSHFQENVIKQNYPYANLFTVDTQITRSKCSMNTQYCIQTA